MFANATRKKFRYPYKGQITTEDLWDLDLEALNTIYIALNKQQAQENANRGLGILPDKPFINEPDEIQQKLDLIRYIAERKHFEQVEREKELVNRSRRQEIAEILQAKRNAELMNKTPEELEAMLNQL